MRASLTGTPRSTYRVAKPKRSSCSSGATTKSHKTARMVRGRTTRVAQARLQIDQHYENIIVWSRDYKRKTSRVWSIPILDYRSLRDWKPHPHRNPYGSSGTSSTCTRKKAIPCLILSSALHTAVACKQMKRHFIAIDNDPEYVKMANQRLTSRKKEDSPAMSRSRPRRHLNRTDRPSKQPRTTDRGDPTRRRPSR